MNAAAAIPGAPPPFVVIGIGNVLLGDDGFGPNVIGILAAGWEFPATVELIDAGTPGLDLAALLCGREAVILVDAVAAVATAGEVLCYRDHELDRALALRPRVSDHDPALAEALAIAALAGNGPNRVVLFGTVPERVDVGVGLSTAVLRAAHAAAAAITGTLADWDAAPQRKAAREAPTLWWADDLELPVATDLAGKG
jgi:hydrogenase maturation protease